MHALGTEETYKTKNNKELNWKWWYWL